MAKPKPKPCKVCTEPFTPSRPLQRVCTPRCAIEYNRQKDAQNREKKRRQSDRERLAAIQPLSHWQKLAQRYFNAFIVVRDAGKPCISCGEMKLLTCGHHRTVAAAPEIRFDSRNANGQCASCNSGSAKYRRNERTVGKQYEKGVIERFGEARLIWVNSPHPPKQYRREELERLAAIFRKRARIYRKIREKKFHGEHTGCLSEGPNSG